MNEIIRLWDNENYEYPLIEIKEGFIKQFEKDIKKIQKKEDYNTDDLDELIEKKDYIIRAVHPEQVFF